MSDGDTTCTECRRRISLYASYPRGQFEFCSQECADRWDAEDGGEPGAGATDAPPKRFWVVRNTEASIARRETLGEFDGLADAEAAAQHEVMTALFFAERAPVIIWDSREHQIAGTWEVAFR